MFTPASASASGSVFVIAELGVNHDGSVQRALELVRAAAEAGADAVKLQLFDSRTLLSNQARLAAYQKAGATDAFAMLDRLKLSPSDMATVRDEARRLGRRFIVTPFSLEDMPVLDQLGVDAVKIASPDAVNAPLLQAAAALGKPMLISTGTCELVELGAAAELARQSGGGGGGCLMQCVSSYPTPEGDAALGGIAALAQAFPGVCVGYSDHTMLVMTGALAVAAGACVLEKHLTYDRDADGPDHAASLDAEEFAEYARLARLASRMVGPLAKTLRPVEREVREVSRQSVCLVRDLPAGHVLTPQDLTIKRPGTGLPAARLAGVVGRTLRRDVKGNDLLNQGDLA